MNAPLRVAVNARALEAGGSPLARLTAAHLVSRLAAESDLRLELFATEPIPAGLSGSPQVHFVTPSGGPLRAATFDQLTFPRAARRSGGQLLLYLHPSAPIAGSAPTVIWYGDGVNPLAKGRQGGRLARSLAQAGMRGAAAVLRSVDMPADPIDVRWVAVPPSVPSAFFSNGTAPAAPASADLPEAFVLAVCESPAALPLLLAAWTWVESSLGDTYALLLAAHNEEARHAVQLAAGRMGLSETVRSVVLADEAWPAVFRRAATLLHAGERQNAVALRWALASNLPVAALATPASESIVGTAGYLVSPPEARALGAACLTLLVEEEIAASLREKGSERARSYRPEAAAPAWAAALREAATGRVRGSPSARPR